MRSSTVVGSNSSSVNFPSEMEKLRRELKLVREENRKLESYKADAMSRMSEVTYNAQTDINLARAELERTRAEAAEERIKAGEKVKASYKNGQTEVKKVIMETETRKKTPRVIRRYWIITIFMLAVSMFMWLAGQQTITGGMKEALNVLKYIFAIIAFCAEGLLIGKVFCGLDDEKIEKKIKREMERKYEYLKESEISGTPDS